MNKSALDDFLSSFDDSLFPEDFLQTYEPMECLANNSVCETLLIRHRQTGAYFVVKCYTDLSLLSHTSESELLKKLNHSGLPAFAEEYRNNEMICVVREYVEGVPLDKLAQEKPLTEQQIISVCVKLCDILTYLHAQTPPIIHRDIKPQNIIVCEDGMIKLIDFGNSRVYNKAAPNDTVFFGTQEFAPPEQYGFSQTDSRSDIFSLGILLCWLLTGETDARKAASRIRNRRLACIIKKCTAFAPEDRCHNATCVRRALANADGHRQKQVFKISCAVLALLLAALLGFAAGRFTDIGLPALSEADIVVFSEPLIEQAVCLQLGKSDAGYITEEELLSVTELYVFGDKAAADEEMYVAYTDDFVRGDGSVLRGSITSLSDITKLKNLRRLSLAYQNISDLTPLKQLVYLEYAELKHNPVQDVSPLKQLTSLTGLFLYDTNVSDLTSLRDCTRLTSLDVGYTLITSISALDGLDSLKTLRLNRTQLKTLDNIGSHTMLEELYIQESPLLDITPLLDLPRLQFVEVSENMRGAAQAIAGEAKFEIIYKE